MRKLPETEQVAFLRELVEYNVRAIVEHGNEARIQCEVLPARLVMTVFVRISDMGLVLGDKGANANAIRRLVWTACKKTGYRVDIDFLTNGSAPP